MRMHPWVGLVWHHRWHAHGHSRKLDMKRGLVAGLIPAAALASLAAYDRLQRRHAIWRNFPVIGHGRNLVELVGPEMRQYWFARDNEEKPFNRDQRSWVYRAAKEENTYFGFGTEEDLEASPNWLIIKQAAFPLPALPKADDRLPGAKVLGGPRGRAKAFRPASAINASAMSYGSLSGPAIEAINRGAKLAGCWQNTGEGGLADHHRRGGDLVFQIGTGYFGCRDRDGRFQLGRLVDLVSSAPVRAIEIKLSQGAKPGLGGVLPAAKVTPEIAAMRGVDVGKDCISPATHSVFHDVPSMLDFVETLAEATGLPIGIKSAVGELGFWKDLAGAMADDPGRGVDFVTVDGGEGGTGAAPLVFADHVALPLKIALARVFATFAEAGIDDRVTFMASGKLGFPEAALLAFALGADLVNVGREAMLSIGCIQAQKCHTGRCPVGVATQSPYLAAGLDPTLKSVRFANYVAALRHEILSLSRACGELHPALVSAEHLEILDGRFGAASVSELFGYRSKWGVPGPDGRAALEALMTAG
jgi:hypothetical protein